VQYHNIDIVGDAWINQGDSPEPRHRIHAIYKWMLVWRGEKFGETLTTMAQPGALPAMYHCMGGQDRTGLISAFLLSLAGVPNDTIAEDYTLTAEYRAHANLEPGAEPAEDTIQKYRARNCPPEVMLDTLQYIDDHHGGVKSFVMSVGVSDEQIAVLREALLG
jgi:protein-tyrosine phosphatase